MKTLVFLLVLANLLFFAYAEGYLGRPDNPDALRVEQQVVPERVKVVSRGEVPASPAKTEPAAEAARPGVAEAAKEEPATICLAWSGLATAEADRLSALLAEQFDAFRQTRHQAAVEGGTWWVFIPPLATKAEADKKAAELKRLGVTDYFIIQDSGPHRFALSLGVFSAETGARDRLAELKELGVKSARVAPRSGKDAQHTVEATGPAGRREALLQAVAGILPGAQSQACK